MVGRVAVVALSLLAGCSFRPSAARTGEDAGSTHGGTPDAAADARVTPDASRVDVDAPAPPDAPSTTTGSLSVSSMNMGQTDIDLSEDGTTDWAHWGYQSNAFRFDRKQGGSGISDVAQTPPYSISGSGLTASWDDGTPDQSGDHDATGYAVAAGGALQLTVAATTAPQVLDLYVSAKYADAQLDLTLSDGSASVQPIQLQEGSGLAHMRYRITFDAASAGQTLTIRWSDTRDYYQGAYAALFSATLY